MSFEEILGAAAGRVVKAITVLENGSSSGDSYLSRHTSRIYSINPNRHCKAKAPETTSSFARGEDGGGYPKREPENPRGHGAGCGRNPLGVGTGGTLASGPAHLLDR